MGKACDYSLKISQLISWKGEINRRDYLIWGIVLFAVKYNLDRLTAHVFNKTWYITDYFAQADKLAVQELSLSGEKFYLTLLLQSIPFIWSGTVLCIKRLRSAKLSPWLVVVFFLPFINFIMFIILAAVPERDSTGMKKSEFLEKLIPRSNVGSAMFAVGMVLLISFMLTGLFINYLEEYGWGMFVGIPFFLGFGSVMIYGYHKELSYGKSIWAAVFSVVFFCMIIFILAFEGLICIAMGFPIAIIIAWIGASLAYVIHHGNYTGTVRVFTAPLIVITLTGLLEHSENRSPPLFDVKTEIIVNASKQTVWDQLVTFGKIDVPEELIFKTGIAYPVYAEINGKGVGAVRKCNFTTGSFIEPITIWDEPDLLEFGVLDQPPPMVEMSIYQDLEIAHLKGYFKSVKGQFKLEELPDEQTKLTGTTWYQHDIWPSFYWKLWSDYILHQIHLRVLQHIKKKAE